LRRGDVLLPLAVGGVTAALVVTDRVLGWNAPFIAGFTFGIPLVLAYLLVDRPHRFAGALVAVWLAGLAYTGSLAPLDFERNFFGTARVAAESDGSHVLIHGTTLHGRQYWQDGRGVNEPLTYY